MNTQFDLQKYYEETSSGASVDNSMLYEFINTFPYVILWGASFQGQAIGKRLLDEGIHIENYWDIRAEEIKECNGIKVIEPFTCKDAERTLVILCIGNRVIFGGLKRELLEKGYSNIIEGDRLYMGILCPFTVDTGVNARRCSQTMECRQIYCHRLGNILSKQNCSSENPIHLTSVTLVINSRCSLGCKFCTSYMNEYPQKKRTDIPFEQICNDIDVFFDAVDSVGTVTVMGGEPFMHPQISQIIEKLCTKKNFGLISIATSGTWPIKEEHLTGLHDERVNISFSNYTESITENQKEWFYKNIETVKKSGVCYTVGLFSPEWIIPSTLYHLDITEQEMTEKKQSCTHWDQLKNGKLHPCDFATALYSLYIADYPSDYVELDANVSNELMREKIRTYLERPYYLSCGHHRRGNGMTSKAAEQGYYDFKSKPEEIGEK